MAIDAGDVALYFYTLGVIVTGIYLQGALPTLFAGTFLEPNRFVLIAIGAIVALPWTVYCERTILPRVPGYTPPGEDGDRSETAENGGPGIEAEAEAEGETETDGRSRESR
jgi:hypothetical protein